MDGQSPFTFSTHGGISSGEEWIWDGVEPTARFGELHNRQPEQILRYFDVNLKPAGASGQVHEPGTRKKRFVPEWPVFDGFLHHFGPRENR